jgi:hypothetical protein
MKQEKVIAGYKMPVHKNRGWNDTTIASIRHNISFESDHNLLIQEV